MDDIKTDLTLENYEEIDVPDTGVNTSSMLILSLIIFWFRCIFTCQKSLKMYR